MKTDIETPKVKEERDIFFTLNPNTTEQEFIAYLQQVIKKVQAWVRQGHNTESNQAWINAVQPFINENAQATNNETNLFQLIKANAITDKLCSYTNAPIFAGDTAYFLAEEWYHENVDTDALVREVTGDPNTTADEVFKTDPEGDYFYFTTYHEPEEILEDILEQGYFYNAQGQKQVLNN